MQAWLNRLLRVSERKQIVESRDIMSVEGSSGTQLFLKSQSGGKISGDAFDFRVCRNGESVIVRPLFESDPALAEAEEE